MNDFFFKSSFILLIQGLLLVGGAGPAHAFETTIEGLCKSIHSQKEEQVPVSDPQKLTFRTQLGMGLMPERYIGVSTEEIKPRPGTKTIVFTMKPDKEVIPDNATIRRSEKENYRLSKGIQSNIKALLKTKDEQDCIARASELKMSDRQLVDYGEILKRSALHYELYQANLFQASAEAAARTFKEGQVIATSSADDVLEQISRLDDQDYNFIFVFHADPTGRLVDYSRFIVEKNFFKKLKERAASVSLFSCYPDKVQKYYAKELEDLKRSGVPVLFPVLKKELQAINSTPLNLLEEFSKQAQKLLE